MPWVFICDNCDPGGSMRDPLWSDAEVRLCLHCGRDCCDKCIEEHENECPHKDCDSNPENC